MALSSDEVAAGVIRPDVRARCQAAYVNRCFGAYQAAANADATKQKKRMELCRRVTNDQDRYVAAFTWQSLTAATNNSLTEFMSDPVNAANVAVLNLWDQLADLLIFDSEVP